MRHPDPDSLRRHAQRLRHEEMRRIACEAGIKWRALAERLRHLVFPGSTRATAHAPHPCQSSAPTHS